MLGDMLCKFRSWDDHTSLAMLHDMPTFCLMRLPGKPVSMQYRYREGESHQGSRQSGSSRMALSAMVTIYF